MIIINIQDSISPFVKDVARNSKSFLASAMKSLGWYFRKETQAGIRSGKPGGKTFAPRHGSLRFRRALNPKAPVAWYGRLRSAIMYEYKSNFLDIGWATPSAAFVADLQEQGNVKVVTGQMRRKFAEAGYPLGTREIINVDERPVFDPMAKAIFPKIESYITNKAQEFLDKCQRRNYARYR